MHALHTRLWLLVLVALAAGGCEALGIKAHVTTVKTGPDGKVEVKTREVRNVDELNEALAEAGQDLGASVDESAQALSGTTHSLVSKLVAAPPPGKVRLKDLNPELEPWQGKPKYDYLSAAAHAGTKDSYDFSYVQVGVASYDDFFREAALTYGYAFQYQHTRLRLRVIAGLILKERIRKDEDLKAVLARVDKTAPSSETREARAHLAELRKMHEVLASDVGAVAQRTSALVEHGQQLVAAAPSSITDPKTALHLDLIVKGLEQSIELIQASADILGGAERSMRVAGAA